jgi:hypothetical protein
MLQFEFIFQGPFTVVFLGMTDLNCERKRKTRDVGFVLPFPLSYSFLMFSEAALVAFKRH